MNHNSVDQVSVKSNFYEQLAEHVFISELLQEAFFRFGKTVEVLRSEIDSSGYDIVLECNGVIRHVQLKTSLMNATTSIQKINVALAEKPSGCVIWLKRELDNENIRIKLRYLFFGNLPGSQLPSLEGFKVAKHTKANAEGIKLERPAIREVPRRCFTELKNTEELLLTLFGDLE